MRDDILSLGLSELCRILREKELTCKELCGYYLDRIGLYGLGDALNCVSAVNHRAPEEAEELDERGPEGLPLFGLCVLLKDNIDVKGMATTAGSVALRDNIAVEDAPFVRTLREKGAVILGKTNMTEFANFLTQGMPAGFSSLGGQVVNAYDKNHSPSGSSSGSAVAMSARLCSFSVGTDTSFSVVACAAENGVVGFKPPVGTITTEGVIPITSAFDEIGFFTRDMADMRYLIESLGADGAKGCGCAPETGDAGCGFTPESSDIGCGGEPLRHKLAVWQINREYVSEEQLGLYEELFGRLRADGWSLTEQPGRNTTKLKELMLRRFSTELRAYLNAHPQRGEDNGNDGPAQKAITPESILAVYREDPAVLAPYGTSYLEESLAFEADPGNASAVTDIRTDMLRERDALLRELAPYDACIMTGPTCIMHYTWLSSLSVPFTAEPADGRPRSVILFGPDMRSLMEVGEEIERHGDHIPMPNLNK